MQNVMKGALALAVVAGATMSASAAFRKVEELKVQRLGTSFIQRGPGGFSTGFEASQGYVQGDIAGQNGWLTNNTVSAPRGVMAVRDGVSAGNGSPNALRFSKGPQAQGQFGVAQSPAVLSSTGLTVDTKIQDVDGANYGLLGFNAAGLSFRIEFDYRGHLFVVEGSSFVDTGVSWVQNQWNSVGVTISATGIQYSYAGSPIHTSPLLPGGTSFDGLQFYHDNYEDLGSTPIALANGSFDNLSVVPSPGAAALLGLGGVAAVRRRRA